MKDINKIEVIIIDSSEMYDKFAPLIIDDANFRSDRYIKLGAIDRDQMLPVGIMIFTDDITSYSIDYMYVDEDYRRIGIATEFMDYLIKLVTLAIKKENKLIGLGCAFDSIDENVYEFLTSRTDMKIKLVSDIYSVKAEQFKNSKLLKSYAQKAGKETSFDSYGHLELCRAVVLNSNWQLTREEINNVMTDVSQLVVKDKKAVGYILATQLKNGDISFDYMYSKDNSKTALLYMIGNAYKTIVRNYPNSEILINLVNNTIKIESFFEEIAPEEKFYVARWNYLPNMEKEEFDKIVTL